MFFDPRLLGLALVAGFSAAGTTPSRDDTGFDAKLGDTVTTCVHRMPAGNKDAYQKWILEVSAPAFRRAGERFPSRKAARSAMRRLVPAGERNDSVVTYVYLWERPNARIEREPRRSIKEGYPAVFEDAGISSDSAKGAMVAFNQLVAEAYCVQSVEEPVPTGR